MCSAVTATAITAAIVFLTGYRPRLIKPEKKNPTHNKMPMVIHQKWEEKRQPNSIPATANVGFAKRLVLDSPPKVPGHRRSSGLLCRGGSSRYHNILVAHVDGLRPCTRTRTRVACKVGPRTSHLAKIDNRDGSRSSILLALSAADRRVPPIVLSDTATTAAGSRAPLSDTMLLFELF